MGSAEAHAGPGGIVLSAAVHAVRTTDYKSMCGAPVVFLFLDSPFAGIDEVGTCPSCRGMTSLGAA